MYKSNNKQIRMAYINYLSSNCFDLNSAYLNPSLRKKIVWNREKKIAEIRNGENIKIISYNNFIFTIGYIATIDNQKSFVYITPTKEMYMPIN